MLNTYEIAGCHKDEKLYNGIDTSNPTQGSLDSKCWILIQQNDCNKRKFFKRDWNSYSRGFGDASGNFWIGNKHLHQMTQVFNKGLQSPHICIDISLVRIKGWIRTILCFICLLWHTKRFHRRALPTNGKSSPVLDTSIGHAADHGLFRYFCYYFLISSVQ